MKALKSEEVIAESLQQINKVFRGSLIIRADDVLRWKLYFRLGRLSWVTGGINFRERLQRHLVISCPNITPKVLKQIPLEHKPQQEQKILVHLQGQGVIQRNQMANLMESIAIEVLFDAIQYGESDFDNLCCYKIAEEQNDNLSLLLPFLDINVVLAKVRQEWDKWKSAGLEDYSPNLYPTVKNRVLLEKAIERSAEKQIINSISGNKTLRGIATKNQKKLLDITLFLVYLEELGAIAFSKSPNNPNNKSGQPLQLKIMQQESINSASRSPEKTLKISDLNRVNRKETILQPDTANKNSVVDSHTISNNWQQPPLKQPVIQKSKKPPLIVCVDDSPLVCRVVKDIVVEQNYRFFDIQEPIKVIPILLRNKPDLIFLDLMMPIINGYELCAQLKKTPSLKDVPIVILTGKDGLIDRMRAKLVGSTDFLAKPVKTFPVLQMLDRYLIANQKKNNHE